MGLMNLFSVSYLLPMNRNEYAEGPLTHLFFRVLTLLLYVLYLRLLQRRLFRNEDPVEDLVYMLFTIYFMFYSMEFGYDFCWNMDEAILSIILTVRGWLQVL
ncbi:hypothetical protein HYFRA_00000073 [Hymenoscyphus fraxineus]|uniref:Uncharacterized protein n=1 Tax=Hymenoscyphus fraxineus TaxID=746836 RepID=A0A9N9L360_9HELO|nr:hypothetical protein HYFRA_00000073 [Hymenoscyphus fraxineus]